MWRTVTQLNRPSDYKTNADLYDSLAFGNTIEQSARESQFSFKILRQPFSPQSYKKKSVSVLISDLIYDSHRNSTQGRDFFQKRKSEVADYYLKNLRRPELPFAVDRFEVGKRTLGLDEDDITIDD